MPRGIPIIPGEVLRRMPVFSIAFFARSAAVKYTLLFLIDW